MAANAIRLLRLARPGGPILMVPMDHGVSAGPIEGIAQPAKTLAAVAGAATCVTVHKGLVPLCAPFADRLGVLLHLSASTDTGPDPHEKRLVGTVEEALRLGCDGVSIHVNVGSATEPRQLEDAGRVSTACSEWGVPLVSMMYPRGPKVKDPHDPALVAHAARLGAELGSDAVKVPFTGKAETFRDAVQGCPVPVIVAGGPRRDSFEAFLADLKAARQAGARGVSIGRNIFQHPRPGEAMAAIARVFA
jgi:fructose-bisphosphate aldolase/2-amino-3,7-dideoxy-D-threo-hept-6-ulosonate synthase